MKGFIKLHRDIQNHWIYEEKRKFSRYEAWLDLLMMANHSDAKVLQDGELIEVKRGERITSIRKLMERWNWSNTKVVGFLELLKKDEMISHKILPKKKTLIKIENYHKWQGFEGFEQSEEKTQKRQQKDTEKTLNNINKNDKECIKNDKEKRNSPKYEICDEESAKLLFKLMRKNNEDVKEPNFDKWSNEMRLIRERDKKTTSQIDALIHFSQNDDFWKSNVLSPAKLRKNWDMLVIQYKQRREKRNEGKPSKPYYPKGDQEVERSDGKDAEENGRVRLYK